MGMPVLTPHTSSFIERTASYLREPEFVNWLVDYISEGGTLVAFCREHKLKYSLVFDYVTGDDVRDGRYQSALRARRANHEDRVIGQILAAAEADPRKLFDKQGNALKPHEIPDELAPAIAGIEVTESEKGVVNRKVRMADRTRNIELLGKTSALFKDVSEVKVSSLADLIQQARAKVRESV